jgi:hypothetical protein
MNAVNQEVFGVALQRLKLETGGLACSVSRWLMEASVSRP